MSKVTLKNRKKMKRCKMKEDDSYAEFILDSAVGNSVERSGVTPCAPKTIAPYPLPATRLSR